MLMMLTGKFNNCSLFIQVPDKSLLPSDYTIFEELYTGSEQGKGGF